MTSDENMHHTRLDPGTFYQPETLWTTNEEQLSVSRGNPDEYDYDLPEDRIRLFPPKNRGKAAFSLSAAIPEARISGRWRSFPAFFFREIFWF